MKQDRGQVRHQARQGTRQGVRQGDRDRFCTMDLCSFVDFVEFLVAR